MSERPSPAASPGIRRLPPPPRRAPRRFFMGLAALGLIGLLLCAAFALKGLNLHADLRVGLAELSGRAEALRLRVERGEEEAARAALAELGQTLDPLLRLGLRGPQAQALERLRGRADRLFPVAQAASAPAVQAEPAASDPPAEAAAAPAPASGEAAASGPVEPSARVAETSPPPARAEAALPSARSMADFLAVLRAERLRVEAMPPLPSELLALALISLLLVLGGLGGRGAAIGREQTERADRAEALQVEAEDRALALRQSAHENDLALRRLAPLLQALGEGDLSRVPPRETEDLASRHGALLGEALAGLRHLIAQVQEAAERVLQGQSRLQAAVGGLKAGDDELHALRAAQAALHALDGPLAALGSPARALRELVQAWPDTLAALRALLARQQAAGEPAQALVLALEGLHARLQALQADQQALHDWRAEAGRLGLNAALQTAQAAGRPPAALAQDLLEALGRADRLLQPWLDARSALSAQVEAQLDLARRQVSALGAELPADLQARLLASEALVAGLPTDLAEAASPARLKPLREALARSLHGAEARQAELDQGLRLIQDLATQAEGLRAAVARFRAP